MKQLVFLLLLFYSCNSLFINNCNSDNYFISPNPNYNTGLKKQYREVFTKFSEIEMTSQFNETGLSCKEVLSHFFHCNICFKNNTNYLQSYSGKFYDLDNTKDPNIFTNNIINLISSMKMGQEEYKSFLDTLKNNFSIEEIKLLKTHFKNSKPQNIIYKKKIKTH